MGAHVQPKALHKYYILRYPLQLRWYPLLKTLGLILVLLLYFGVGVGVKALVAGGRMPPLDAPGAATPTFLLRFTPVVLAALVFSGVAAATMSAVNSFINIAAAVVTHDIPVALGRKTVNELKWGVFSTAVVAVAAALLAQLSGSMVSFRGIFGWGLFACTLVPALAIGLNWEGATKEGAIASIATGLAVTLTFETLSFFKVYT